MDHHPHFSPSSIHRVFSCPASVNLTRSVARSPEGRNERAERGTKLHDIAFGSSDPEDEGINLHDLRAVQWVRERIKLHAAGETFIERRLSVSDITWGTADLVAIARNEAVVLDAKFHASGAPSIDSAAEQSLCYALGVLEEWPGVDKVSVYILVPASETEYQFTIRREDYEIGVERLRDGTATADRASLADKNNYYVGEHCYYCPALLCCSAIQDEVGL